jgi:hypothetical protein
MTGTISAKTRAQYEATVGLNWSTLKGGLISPLHMKSAIDDETEDKDTRDMRFGRALHCLLLEPDRFAESWKTQPRCSAVTNKGKDTERVCGNLAGWSNGLMDEYAEYACGTHSKKWGDSRVENTGDFLSEKDMQKIQAAAESVRGSEAFAMLKGEGWQEATVEWDDHGLTLKGQLDRYLPANGNHPGLILDIKKVQVGGCVDDEISKTITNRHYAHQLAYYRRGIETITGKRPHCVLLFVEDAPPYDVCLAPIDLESLSIADIEIDHLLNTYRSCIEAGQWPGSMRYSMAVDHEGRVKSIGLSKWYRKTYQDDERVERVDEPIRGLT